MKKFFTVFLVLSVFTAAIDAKNTYDNEVTAGSAGYLGYSIDAGIRQDKIEYGLLGAVSRASLYDWTLDAGVSVSYEFSGDISAETFYYFGNCTSYPVVDLVSSTNFLTYKNVLGKHSLGFSGTFTFLGFELEPSAFGAFNILAGSIIVQRQGGITDPENLLAEYSFGEFGGWLDASYEIAGMLSVKAGGGGNFYTGDVAEILEASGTSNTVISADTAVKDAVKFLQYGLSAGVSFYTDEFMAGIEYAYSAYWHPDTGSTNDFSGDLILMLKYAFDKGFIGGIRGEYIKSHYTDGSFLDSWYLGLLLNFTAP